MKVIASLCFAFLFAAVSPAAEPVSSAATNVPESLVTLAQKVRPDFLLGSFASGLDPGKKGNQPLIEFFRRNFNIMTVGIYMTGTQRERDAYNFEKTDALIQFAQENNLKVYLHPMIGGAEYTPKWVNDGGLSAEALQQVMRDRITTILTRYKGRIHYVDVVNESLTGKGRKADGQFEWQEKSYRGGDHVWFKTLGMYQGKKHQFPRYLVESFRIAREVGGPDLKLILNEWGNETTKSPRSHAFLALIQALKEEGIPVDGAGLQLHCRLRDGQLHGWANNQAFDFDAFDAMLKLYEQAGIEVHITEFDIHLGANPTPQVFELQGKYYDGILRHALQSPAVKSFKTWGFTDRHSWKADGQDGHPLLLDENLQPKPAYLRQVEMLRALAPKAMKPAARPVLERLSKGINTDFAPLGSPVQKVPYDPAYLDAAKGAGFESIRFFVGYASNPGVYERIVKDALERGLAVVLCMWAGNTGQAEFVRAWEAFARHYQDFPEGLVFELFNEPKGSKVTDERVAMQWLSAAIPSIRNTNPTRLLLLGGPEWNQVEKLDFLNPEHLNYKLADGTGFAEDRNLAGACHYYSPYKFTHSNGTKLRLADQRDWQQDVRRQFDFATAWCRRWNKPVLMTEWGMEVKLSSDPIP